MTAIRLQGKLIIKLYNKDQIESIYVVLLYLSSFDFDVKPELLLELIN